MELNQPAPDFSLPDLDSHLHRLSDYRGRNVILNFWSAECPHVRRADGELIPWLTEWDERASLLSVASNVNERPELLRQVAAERGIPLVLWDSRHEVADAYQAQITPQLFVIDADGLLRYQGAFDDVTFRQRVATRSYLKDAVEALLAGRSPDLAETAPYGCTIVRYVS
jgi:peroxiredoxin